MAALRKLAAAATTSAVLAAPRARAEEAAPDEAHAAELRAKLLANEDLLKASETLVSELEGKSPSLAAEVGGVSRGL